MKKTSIFFLFFSFLILQIDLYSQYDSYNSNKFKQLHEELPTPNVYRTAAGTPGHQYWQQRADYEIDVSIDDVNHILYGEETITYHNLSPDTLRYLWVQLDQNVREKNSSAELTRTTSFEHDLSNTFSLHRLLSDYDGGFKINSVKLTDNSNMDYHIVGTMMRIELPSPLTPETKISFSVSWHYNINNTNVIPARSGYEPFSDGNSVYCIAQFYPRMCVYNDVEGWQNKQFLGRGEFALPFGDFSVSITVPDDHLVAATGTLQNPKKVLSSQIRSRLQAAEKEFEQPVIIVSAEEAKETSKNTAKDIEKTKTWIFQAKNVRDFAFATSRRFIWDAMNTKLPNGKTAMAMSMYIQEGKPLWEKYSTKAVAHTLKWYSHYTIDYPYPVAWSIDGNMGMEYPMICFNYGRCAEDGTYSKRTKYGHIGVIIHEVGHNFFPMIINSDERQWTWMDEGLNTFVQFLTEQQWERNFPSRRGQPYKIVDYMKGDKNFISPIMTNSESIFQFGNNAYGKPATALNILRETIIGRENFDYAFKKYCENWAFRHPTPADLFRSLEDASGIDLDWFWRGWFYTTDHVDIALSNVRHTTLSSETEENLSSFYSSQYNEVVRDITNVRNAEEIGQTYSEEDTTILDFYNRVSPVELDVIAHEVDSPSSHKRELIAKDKHFYELTFENFGGLVMPIITQFFFVDGTCEIIHIPAEIWRYNDKQVNKVFVFDQEVEKIIIDPFLQTADCDLTNNYFPSLSSNPDSFIDPRENFNATSSFNNRPNEMQLFKMKSG